MRPKMSANVLALTVGVMANSPAAEAGRRCRMGGLYELQTEFTAYDGRGLLQCTEGNCGVVRIK